MVSNLLDAIPCNGNTGSQNMDDECYNTNPVFINADGLVDTPSNYFNSRSKYCLEYDTSYQIFSEWRLEGATWASAYGIISMNSSWQVNCQKNGIIKPFWQDNSGSPSCPSGWSYVSHIGSSGARTPYVLNGAGQKQLATSSCGTTGTDVWYK